MVFDAGRLMNMPNGVRGSVLALFFVLGMAFMGAMFLFARPDWGWHEKGRVIEEPAKPKVVSFVRRETETVFLERPVVEEKEEVIAEQSAEAKPENRGVAVETRVEAKTEVLDRRPDETESRVGGILEDSTAGGSFGNVARSELPLSVPSFAVGKGLRGRVWLVGEAPPAETMEVDRICGERLGRVVKSQTYVVGRKGELKDVVVEAIGKNFDRRWPAPTEPVVIRVRNCLFEPYVSVMRIGQRLVLENEDGIMHNFHWMPPPGMQAFNRTVFARRKEEIDLNLPPDLMEAHFVTAKCDVHPWMFTYVSLVNHPFFAVTDREGRFEIKGLPHGEYMVRARHRRAGALEKKVTVRKGGAEVEFEFRVGRAPRR